MAKILIIEDDEKFRGMLFQMLRTDGHEVLEASNGVVGIKLNNEKKPDLVITDIFMPEKEGLGTILELRAENPYLKIIAMSGGGKMGSTEYIESAVDFGADFAFKKPFERREFLGKIEELLKK